jgi:hypothetical protein
MVGATGTKADLTALRTLAADPNKLLDKLNLVFMHNTLSPTARAAILAAVNAVPATDPLGRARAATYLVATAAQYQVEQ